jgi:hypothetical protein
MGYFGGDQSSLNDSFGVSILSFYDAELRIENDQNIDLFFQDGNALSTYDGHLLLYSNNTEIRNNEDQIIVNGFLEQNGSSEQILPQSFVFLPFESSDTVHYVHMTYDNGFPQLGENFSSLILDLSEEIGIYDQIENIIPNSLALGQLTACRHANGRDWWVIVAGANEPLVYSILFTPNGVMLTNTIEVDYNMKSGLGQSTFSPDGTKYIRVNLVGGIDDPDYLDIFDFDRSTGLLSSHKQTVIGNNAFSGGASISPSSQFLYITHYNYVYQYDLWSEDIFATKDTIAIYDGYQELNQYSSRFYLSHLAPNGKIYINSPTSLTKLHVIEYPDRRGEECTFRQHYVQLPNWNIATLANHPNYRLGPIDGSFADTLSIDNLPTAFFRIDREAEDTLVFHFQDLSFHDPDTWSWNFGDGGSSTERHPDHSYSNSGIYEVCLTVTNSLGMDTKCRIIELGPSSSANEFKEVAITTFPNPVLNILIFDLGDYFPQNGLFKLFDASGREVISERVLSRQAQFDLSTLPSGAYHYIFNDGGFQLGSGKIVCAN